MSKQRKKSLLQGKKNKLWNTLIDESTSKNPPEEEKHEQ